MILSAIDHLAIFNLYATYNHLEDGEDPIAFGHCYSEDGKLTSAGRPIAKNRNEIIEFRRSSIANRGATVRRHFTSNIRLDQLEPSVVEGHTYLQGYDFTPGSEARLTHSATSRDVIVKVHGHWLFSSRELILDYAAR